MSSSRYIFNNEDFEKLTASLLYISTSKYEMTGRAFPISITSLSLSTLRRAGDSSRWKAKYQVSEGDLIIIPPDMEHTELSFDCYPLEYIAVGVSGIAFRDNKTWNGSLSAIMEQIRSFCPSCFSYWRRRKNRRPVTAHLPGSSGCPADPPCPEAGASSGSLHPVQDDKGVQSD